MEKKGCALPLIRGKPFLMNSFKSISKKTVLEQTKEYLVTLIMNESAGAEGDMIKLPAEVYMAQRMGVSRTTLRQALSELESQGMVIRIHGKGTFINSHFAKLNEAYNPSVEYEALIRANGYEPTASFISRSETVPEEKTARLLELSPGETTAELHSIYYADGKPCIYNIDWIPSSIFPESYDEEEYLKSVFNFLEKHTGRKTERNHIVLTSCSADEVPGESLSAKSAIVAKTIFYDSKNEPLFCSIGYYDTTLIQFHLINQTR